MQNPPVWADGVDAEIVERAIKDHGYYEGLEVKTNIVNVNPDGEQCISDYIRVTIGDIAFIQNSSLDYIDCFWSVSIHSDDLRFVKTKGLATEDLDPYIQSITYRFGDDGQIKGYYRSFLSIAKEPITV